MLQNCQTFWLQDESNRRFARRLDYILGLSVESPDPPRNQIVQVFEQFLRKF